MMELSEMGRLMNARTGINDLMDDLYEAIHSGRKNLCQLNGGAPAAIPDMVALWRRSMRRLLETGEFEIVTQTYGSPRGYAPFIANLAAYLRTRMGWEVTEENLCATQGGQMAFFMLFNLLADKVSKKREILFPLCPDYIGYQAQSLSGPGLFRGVRPRIEKLEGRWFKYGVDFDRLDIRPETAAIALSRPANPTGNIVTDAEMGQLRRMAAKAGILVMVDNAYGQPFPQITSVPHTTPWDGDMMMGLSLSKIGLPGTRTGIVVARKELIDLLVRTGTAASLCPNNLGAALVAPWLADGTLDRACTDWIAPFYRGRADFLLGQLEQWMPEDIPWRVHRREGGMFLWLWLEGLPVPAQELYVRCRSRGCFVNPGHHFFFALPSSERCWRHPHECLRLSYARDDAELERGVRILAEETARAYARS